MSMKRRDFLKVMFVAGACIGIGFNPKSVQAQINITNITRRSEISDIGMTAWLAEYARLIDAAQNISLTDNLQATNERERIRSLMQSNGFTIIRSPNRRKNGVEFYAYENSNALDLDVCNVFFPSYASGRKPVFESASIIGASLAMYDIYREKADIATPSNLARMFLPTDYRDNPEPEDLWSRNQATFGEYVTENGRLRTEYDPTGSGGWFIVEAQGRYDHNYRFRVQ